MRCEEPRQSRPHPAPIWTEQSDRTSCSGPADRQLHDWKDLRDCADRPGGALFYSTRERPSAAISERIFRDSDEIGRLSSEAHYSGRASSRWRESAVPHHNRFHSFPIGARGDDIRDRRRGSVSTSDPDAN